MAGGLRLREARFLANLWPHAPPANQPAASFIYVVTKRLYKNGVHETVLSALTLYSIARIVPDNHIMRGMPRYWKDCAEARHCRRRRSVKLFTQGNRTESAGSVIHCYTGSVHNGVYAPWGWSRWPALWRFVCSAAAAVCSSATVTKECQYHESPDCLCIVVWS
jgi:hypothetical protein